MLNTILRPLRKKSNAGLQEVAVAGAPPPTPANGNGVGNGLGNGNGNANVDNNKTNNSNNKVANGNGNGNGGGNGTTTSTTTTDTSQQQQQQQKTNNSSTESLDNGQMPKLSVIGAGASITMTSPFSSADDLHQQQTSGMITPRGSKGVSPRGGDCYKTLLSEIQFLERLLQDQISMRNSTTRANKQSSGELLREGEAEDDELRRYEEQLKRIIEAKKADFRVLAENDRDKDKQQDRKPRPAFLKSGTAISIFPSVIEERLCSSLPLVRIEKIKIKRLQQQHEQELLHSQQQQGQGLGHEDTAELYLHELATTQQPDSSNSSSSNKDSNSDDNDSTVSGHSGLEHSQEHPPITSSIEELDISISQADLSELRSLLPKPLATLVGPGADLPDDEQNFHNIVCCKSNSSYPMNESCGKRQGDPICDKFKAAVYRDNMIVSLADGCNWGRLPFEAATRATDAFMSFMEENYHEINTVRKAGSFLLGAITAAHKGIISGRSELWESGTTTLIGGLLSKIKKEKSEGTDFKSMSSLKFIDVESDWVFTGVTLGDCKAFHYSSKCNVFSDITKGNRQNLSDARDPGGRLGPYIGEGQPDLRNLAVFHKFCDQDDVILLLSDGVHDNLDPQQLGLSPRDLGVDCDSWDIAGQKLPVETDRVKNEFRNKWLLDHLTTTTTDGGQDNNIISRQILPPQQIASTLLKHCVETTQTSRDFMENNSTKKLPSDYKLYPGKMDHNTCVCFRVGANNV
ncbi:hypothetical protein SAMD00019534_047690 [Acytostelium subglobosum LB1]|uniref:hypothetical protein n=1 Tax=Acytostelium subglobosum LB1 TaxID=1410327 RepID=UPI000644819B|nr:hypothetical protein SAMD00019534_047690 [Acytostelium subglobosum LB1]GAM21594.1 hypothetical protein SAMD00019534_047690 [Acytostelium subglobosum LB1]|eukprot:XP_012755713.1 hypothetical protein SAMD00019534_047690 [Acytostelium subglobosum LB1]